MLVAYDTLVLIAFVQIMFLVRSKRYQRLYGSDPLNPVLNAMSLKEIREGSPGFQQPIIIYVMPRAGQKLWAKQQQKWWKDEIILDDLEEEKDHVKEDSSDYFQREELLSKILLRNAINGNLLKK